MIFLKSRHGTLAIAMSLLIVGGAAQMQVFGQQQQQDPRARKQNKDLPENRAEKLKTFIDTPGIPKYEGKCEFEQGVIFRQAVSGPSITMKFVCADRKEKVLAWYKQQFENGKWEIEKVTTDPERRIGGTKAKNICRVLVDDCPDPWFPTRVTLTYRLYQPHG